MSTDYYSKKKIVTVIVYISLHNEIFQTFIDQVLEHIAHITENN